MGTLLIRLAIIGLLCGLGFNLSRLLPGSVPIRWSSRCRWISGMLAVLFSVAHPLGIMVLRLLRLWLSGRHIPEGKDGQEIVALTFDDGPSPLYTPRILDILAEKQVPAAFFMVGAHVDKYPDIAARIAAEGHELGSHTYDHVNVPTLPTARLSAQLLKTNIAILNATGDYPLYIRPPRGLYDGRFRRLSELLGHQIVLWSLSAQDWMELMTVDRIVSASNHGPSGDIILSMIAGLCCAGGPAGSRRCSAPLIIEGLWERGYQIVPLAELLTLAHPEEEPIPYMPE